MYGNDDIPIGLTMNEELLNLLLSLALSGGADLKTLYLVAQGRGIQEPFSNRLRRIGREPIELGINQTIKLPSSTR